MAYFLVTFVFMAIVIAIMAIGVIFGRRAIKGSCGGAANNAD
ncbi:MAG: (Na+)-NQR maturation NqrM, partial [Methylobacter sp.]